MNWYLVKIIYQIITGSGNHTPQFDEQIRLISADSHEEALEKAKALGMKEEEGFLNEKQQWVRWKYIDVSEMVAVKCESDGTEVWSRITECLHPDVFIRNVRRRASRLHQQYSRDFIPFF